MKILPRPVYAGLGNAEEVVAGDHHEVYRHRILCDDQNLQNETDQAGDGVDILGLYEAEGYNDRDHNADGKDEGIKYCVI